jgi:hypothetical protein
MFVRPGWWVLGFALLFAARIGAQDKLVLSPARPKVGQPCKVMLDPLPADNALPGEYQWQIKVLDEEGNDVTATAAPGEGPNRPELTIATVGPDLQYHVTLTRTRGDTPMTFSLRAESGATVLALVAGDLPMPGTPPPGLPPAPAPAVAVPEPPTAGELREMGARLEAAKRWAEDIVTLPKSDDLVVAVDFFSTALAKRADGTEGLLEFTHRPLLDAAELHRAMYGAANRFPAESDADSFISAWHDEKPRFLKALEERNANTPLIVGLWNEFTDRWEREALAAGKERFRVALTQAPMIVTGLLLEFDKKHIEAAMTGGPPAGTSRGTTTVGGGYYGSSHAAVRHHRIMSRIHYRHERRMTRIGY